MAPQQRYATTRRRSRPRALPSASRRPSLEELEPRLVLAPMIADGVATATDLSDIFSIQPVTSEVTGRIEVAPIGFAGGDTFVVERLGPDPDNDGVIERPGAPEVGTISRVTRGGDVTFFASVPGGDLGFGGYTNFFDLVFDPIGIFDGVPSLFVSTSAQVEDPDTPLMENAIYRFDASGNLLNGGPFAAFTEDSDGDLTYDDHPTVMALAPLGSDFPPGLYVADVEQESNVEFDDMFIFHSNYTPGAIIDGGLLPTGVEFVPDLSGRVLPPDGPLQDLDLRSIVFDPGNLYNGTLLAQSTDLEDGTAATSLMFDSPSAQSAVPFPNQLIQPLTTDRWTDATFDPTGFFSTDDTGAFIGSYFIADNAGGGNFPTLHGVLQRMAPTGNLNNSGPQDPFAFNFNVGITDLNIDPIGGLDRAFSLSFSPDGQRLLVADLDGIWEIRSDIGLPCSDAGQITGVCDVQVDLGRPYLGGGMAIAVIDSGIDASHPGFGGLVTEGVDVALGNATGFAGTLDEVGHGTAVAGIIHQIAPEAVIVPVKIDIAGTGGASNRQIIWEAIKWVADHPIVQNPINGQLVPIVAGNMSIGLINSELVYDSEVEAATIDPTSLYTYKDQFQRWAALGIVPMAAAGNEGLFFEAAMDAMDMPAVINEVVSAAASYPYGPTPPLPPPAGCTLEAGDLIAYPDKVAAFSSRSQDTDFEAPGTCIRTFNPVDIAGLPSGLPPIQLNFNGTSAATPFTVGIDVMVQSAVQFWAGAAATGSSTAGFLGGSPTAPVPLPGIPNLGGYLSPNGINAILQWTAQPHEDRNLDPPPDLGPPIEDLVFQQGRLELNMYGDIVESQLRGRVYSRVDAGNAVAAIEGTIAFNYFTARPALIAQLAGGDSIVTAAEIQAFVNNPANDATARAMAGLLGGTSSSALMDRTDFFDMLDGPNGLLEPDGIHVSQFSVLAAKLLPSTSKFHITQRIQNGNEGYLVDPTAVRDWHDLTFMLPSANFVSGIPAIYRGQSPASFGGSTALALKNMFPRDPDDFQSGNPATDPGDGQTPPDDGTTDPGTDPPPTPGQDDPGSGGDTTGGNQAKHASAAVFRDGIWFIDTDHAGGAAERAFAFGIPGDDPVAADFNGDGQTDAAVFRDGIWFIDLDGNGGAAEMAFAFGISGDVPVAGDFNGDGRADAAVFRNGLWFFDLDGAGGAAENAIAFGESGDVPVPADYNDDGRADAAVFRNGLWFFDFDGTGGAAEHAIAFGAGGDVPVAASWQMGPERAAVFRNGIWFFDMDGNGGFAEHAITFGIPGDVPLAFLDASNQDATVSLIPDQSDQTPVGSDPVPLPVNQPGNGEPDSGNPDGTGDGTGGSTGNGTMTTVLDVLQPQTDLVAMSPDAGQDDPADLALEDLVEEWSLENLLL